MNNQRFNWQIWVGLLLSLIALFSYPLVFVRFPVTRDFPWVNLLLFGISAILLFVGLRRAFAPRRRLRSKITGVVLAASPPGADSGSRENASLRTLSFPSALSHV